MSLRTLLRTAVTLILAVVPNLCQATWTSFPTSCQAPGLCSERCHMWRTDGRGAVCCRGARTTGGDGEAASCVCRGTREMGRPPAASVGGHGRWGGRQLMFVLCRGTREMGRPPAASVGVVVVFLLCRDAVLRGTSVRGRRRDFPTQQRKSFGGEFSAEFSWRGILARVSQRAGETGGGELLEELCRCCVEAWSCAKENRFVVCSRRPEYEDERTDFRIRDLRNSEFYT